MEPEFFTNRLTIQAFIYYLIYSGPGEVFRKLCSTRFTVDTQKTRTKVILSLAVPQNTRGAFRTLSNIYDRVFLQNVQFIIDIWKGPNAFELVYVSRYKGVWSKLTRIFQCY